MNPTLVTDATFLFVALMSVGATVISFLTVRMIRQIDQSQKELWVKFDDHATRLAHLEGEHCAFIRRGVHP
jgi:hypothetical protein